MESAKNKPSELSQSTQFFPKDGKVKDGKVKDGKGGVLKRSVTAPTIIRSGGRKSEATEAQKLRVENTVGVPVDGVAKREEVKPASYDASNEKDTIGVYDKCCKIFNDKNADKSSKAEAKATFLHMLKNDGLEMRTRLFVFKNALDDIYTQKMDEGLFVKEIIDFAKNNILKDSSSKIASSVVRMYERQLIDASLLVESLKEMGKVAALDGFFHLLAVADKGCLESDLFADLAKYVSPKVTKMESDLVWPILKGKALFWGMKQSKNLPAEDLKALINAYKDQKVIPEMLFSILKDQAKGTESAAIASVLFGLDAGEMKDRAIAFYQDNLSTMPEKAKKVIEGFLEQVAGASAAKDSVVEVKKGSVPEVKKGSVPEVKKDQLDQLLQKVERKEEIEIEKEELQELSKDNSLDSAKRLRLFNALLINGNKGIDVSMYREAIKLVEADKKISLFEKIELLMEALKDCPVKKGWEFQWENISGKRAKGLLPEVKSYVKKFKLCLEGERVDDGNRVSAVRAVDGLMKNYGFLERNVIAGLDSLIDMASKDSKLDKSLKVLILERIVLVQDLRPNRNMTNPTPYTAQRVKALNLLSHYMGEIKESKIRDQLKDFILAEGGRFIASRFSDEKNAIIEIFKKIQADKSNSVDERLRIFGVLFQSGSRSLINEIVENLKLIIDPESKESESVKNQALALLKDNIFYIDNSSERLNLANKIAVVMSKGKTAVECAGINKWLRDVEMSYVPTLVMDQMDVNQRIKYMKERLGDSFKPSEIAKMARGASTSLATVGLEPIDGKHDNLKLNKYPYTASEAQMKLLLGNDYEEIPNNGNFGETKAGIESNLNKLFRLNSCSGFGDNEALRENVLNMLLLERKHEDRLVFYHAASASIGLLYKAYSVFRENFLAKKNPEVQATFRVFEESFLKIPTLEEFLQVMTDRYNAKTANLFNYVPGYDEMGAAFNTTLFGNMSNNNSFTLGIWATNSRADDAALYHVAKGFLQFLGDDAFVNAYAAEYVEILKKLDGGTMVQAFVKQDVADSLGYFCESGGAPVDMEYDDGKTHSLEKAVVLLRTDPEKYKEVVNKNTSVFKQGFAEKSTVAAGASDAAEARMVVDPRVTENTSLYQTYWYHSHTSASSADQDKKRLHALEEEQGAFIHDVTRKTYEFGRHFSREYISAAGGQATPLEKLMFAKKGADMGLEGVDAEFSMKLHPGAVLAFQRRVAIRELKQAMDEGNQAKVREAENKLTDLEQAAIPKEQRTPHKRTAGDDQYIVDNLGNNEFIKSLDLKGPKAGERADEWLGNQLRANDFSPRQLVELFYGYEEMKVLMDGSANVAEGYTVKEHTLRVLDEFLGTHDSVKNGTTQSGSNTNEKTEDGNIEGRMQSKLLDKLGLPEGKKVELKRFLATVLVLHDIAKSCSNEYQHEYTTPVLVKYLLKLGYSEEQVNLAANLIDHDFLGDFVREGAPMHGKAWERVQQSLESFAAVSGVDYDTLFTLQVLFYTSDANSYPNVRSQYFEEAKDPELKGVYFAKQQGDVATKTIIPLERVVMDTLISEKMLGGRKSILEDTQDLIRANYHNDSHAFKLKLKSIFQHEQQNITPKNHPSALEDVSHVSKKDGEVRKELDGPKLSGQEMVSVLSGYPELKDLFSNKLGDETVGGRTQKAIDAMMAQGSGVLAMTNRMDADKAMSMLKVVTAFSFLGEGMDKEHALEHTTPLMMKYMAKLGYALEDINLATSMLALHYNEPTGQFASKTKAGFDPVATQKVVKRFAEFTNLPRGDFVALQALFDSSLAVASGEKLEPAAGLAGLMMPVEATAQHKFMKSEVV